MTLKTVICYAPEDERFKTELDKHLISLKLQGLIAIWDYLDVMPGQDWKRVVEARLDEARLVLLLISSDFLNSDHCYSIMRYALQRDTEGSARVIPIILRPIEGIQVFFRTTSTLPHNGTPITSWLNQDAAFSEIAHGLRSIVYELRTQYVLQSSGNLLTIEPIKLAASIAELYLDAGNRYYHNRQYQEALLAYEQALGLYQSRSILFQKGHTLFQLQRYEAALETYVQAVDKVDQSDYFSLDSPGLSEAQSRELHEKVPQYDNTVATYTDKGTDLYAHIRYEEALTAFEQAIRLAPTSYAAYTGKGASLHHLGRYKEALTAYEQAIRLLPNSADTHIRKGATLHHLGRYKEALAAFEQAIRLAPGSINAYIDKGATLYDLEHYEEALAAFEQAIRLAPGSTEAYTRKGATLRKLKRYEEALTAFEQAIRLAPSSADAYRNKGECLLFLERIEEADQAFNQARRIDLSKYFIL